VSDYISLHIEFSPLSQWTHEAAEFVQREVLAGKDEPLAHELLREAMANRKTNPRSSLVMAVAGAKVGFKRFVARALPQSSWLLELPAPPLVDMLNAFPWSELNATINDNQVSVPGSIKDEVKKAVLLRNKLVHDGAVELKKETLASVLSSVHDLLYFLDALSRESWALQFSGAAQAHFRTTNSKTKHEM
jgi:hypothetical protein